MSNYEAFGRLESEGWSDSSRASSYAELFAEASDHVINPLLNAAHAKAGDKALDLCCGHGNVTEALKARGCAVWGVDFSPSMLEMARARVPDAVLVEGNAQNLPFEEEDFDVVVSNFGICHVPDQPRALAEAHRVLRGNGRSAMTAWCGPDESPWLAVIDCFFDLDEPERLCEIFEKATVRAAMLLASQPSERLSAIRSALAATVRERFAHSGRWRVPLAAAMVSARK